MGENGATNGNGATHAGIGIEKDHIAAEMTKSTPYQSVQDYLSNVNKFKIIESTLREGEQFANAFFDTETKIKMSVLPRQLPK